MQKIIIITVVLLLSGCAGTTDSPRTSSSDVVIENLSRTTDQLDSIRREKDFYVKVWNDSEDQKTSFAELMSGSSDLDYDAESFAKWHENIAAREEQIARQHALNVLLAHIRIHQMTDESDANHPAAPIEQVVNSK